MALVSVGEQNRSLNLYYGANKGSIASPSHEVALYVGDPSIPADQGGGVELDAAGGYVRPVIANDGTTWPGAADGATSSTPVAFDASTGEWTVDGAPAVADYFLLIATDTGDAGDSGRLDAPVSVGAAGAVVKPTLTVFYNPTS
jgi:hypothetical protein